MSRISGMNRIGGLFPLRRERDGTNMDEQILIDGGGYIYRVEHRIMEGGREAIYSLYNASQQEVRGALFCADIAGADKKGAFPEELWTREGEPFVMEKGTVSGCASPEKVYIFKVTCEQTLS